MVVCTRGARWAGRFALVAVLTLTAVHSLNAVPAAPVLYPAVVAGPQITLAWSPVPGAAGYRLGLGTGPAGPEVFTHTVGAGVTSVSFNSPFVGTGYIRVQAFDATGLSAGSNIIQVTVTTLAPIPAAPVNLQAFISGHSVLLTWGPGPGGGAPQAVQIEVGSAPGAANLVSTYLPLSTQLNVPSVPLGSYYVRVYAVSTAGRSAASNEIRIDLTPGGGCTSPPASSLSTSVSGNTVSFAWTPVPGVAGYLLEVAAGPSGPVLVSQTFPPSVTNVSYPGAPGGTFYARVTTGATCGARTPSAVASFTVAGPPPGARPRTPDPPPGIALPLPNMSALVNHMANAYRGELLNSCREHGGNNAWLFRLVNELRRYDSRWGLNWKRANVGDMSQDVVTYNYSNEPDEGTYWVYVVDVIGGHCGPDPGGFWLNHTRPVDLYVSRGARWTLQPFIAAGGQP